MSSENPAAQTLDKDARNDGAAARAALREWILGKNKDIDPGELSDRTRIFETRYLRSVHLPELILLIERLRGAPLDVEDLVSGDFRDIDTIVAQFIVRSHDTEPAA
jgi:hypothetical protein